MTLPAKPERLYSGEWGARVSGPANVGDTITITTRGGKSWDARVTAVQATVGTDTIVATDSKPPSKARGRGRSRRGGSTYTRLNSGAEIYTNRNGRCEDAPCCGCCS